MQYTATATSSEHFEVTAETGAPAGSLDYASWLRTSAQITTADGIVYDIAPSGFWRTGRLITRDGCDFAELKPDFSRGAYLSFANGISLHFKTRNFWNNSRFTVLDGNGDEIAAVQYYFEWRRFRYRYDISLHNAMADRETGAMLPVLLLYCARLVHQRKAT